MQLKSNETNSDASFALNSPPHKASGAFSQKFFPSSFSAARSNTMSPLAGSRPQGVVSSFNTNDAINKSRRPSGTLTPNPKKSGISEHLNDYSRPSSKLLRRERANSVIYKDPVQIKSKNSGAKAHIANRSIDLRRPTFSRRSSEIITSERSDNLTPPSHDHLKNSTKQMGDEPDDPLHLNLPMTLGIEEDNDITSNQILQLSNTLIDEIHEAKGLLTNLSYQQLSNQPQ